MSIKYSRQNYKAGDDFGVSTNYMAKCLSAATKSMFDLIYTHFNVIDVPYEALQSELWRQRCHAN